MAKVILNNITKFFGHNRVLDQLALSVDDHEFLVLVGPSGCGKSTLLKIIAGLEEATEGAVTIGTQTVTGLPPQDRDIAMVFQSYALYPHMTVYDNMAFGLRMRKVAKGEIDRMVCDVADTLDIAGLLQRKPRQLSGGERQRVALGRAIVRSPRVFLLDEPLSNLDARLRVLMRSEIIKLHRKLQATMIYVTHDQTEAMTMGDRIAVMNGGRILQLGTPEEIYNRPSSLFVAGFIGMPPMNLLPWRQGLILGIRPEQMTVDNWDGGDDCLGMNLSNGDFLLSGRLEVVEYTGADKILYLQTIAGQVVVKADCRQRIIEEQTYRLSFKSSNAHCFDAVSGLRLDHDFIKTAIC